MDEIKHNKAEGTGKRVLIVGAGGFIGGFIAEQGLTRGYDVTVTVRESTSLRYLTDERLKFVVLDYDDPAQIESALAEALPEGEAWDYVIYNLGATKCANFLDFDRINYRYLVNVVEALKAVGKTPARFLFMSSLSAMGPVDEETYRPITNNDVPNPNTRYGLSKMKAEQYIMHQSGLDYVIFRATGVYGPHEKDYLMMIKSIDSHIDVGMGYRKQMLTFIYVDDLVGAMYDALAAGVSRKVYIIAEPQAYTQKEFRDIVSKELGGRWVLPLKLPMWAVLAVSTVTEKIGAWRGKPSTLNRDKYKIMKQRNWNADVSDAVNDFGFHADYPLVRGVHETVAAYLADKHTKKH